MTESPYSGKPESEWLGITQRLVASHPLEQNVLRDAVIQTWATLWQTTVGAGGISMRLTDLNVPATIVGYFFEVLLTRELEHREPALWRGSRSKEEKDLVYIPNPALSVEIKTSGQAGFKVYGNRSYGQKSETELLVKKEKSGVLPHGQLLGSNPHVDSLRVDRRRRLGSPEGAHGSDGRSEGLRLSV